jgi:Flp pilus assembly secretin CpaC
VILVTPYIVKPVDDPSQFLTPTDGMEPSNDFERILLGRLSKETPMLEDSERPDPESPLAAMAGIGGDAGFLLR